MRPITRAFLRLLTVQSAWTYDRMLGIGIGYASAPLLQEIKADRNESEQVAMIARSAEFFNSHPYLAGIGVGALTRAEKDRVPGETVQRLRSALSGPLGALGDQLFWAGQVPALIGIALIATPWFGISAVLLILILHNVSRLYLTYWGLKLGMEHGLTVGAALQNSPLPSLAALAQSLAALAVGLALPIISAWLVRLDTTLSALMVISLALFGLVLGLLLGSRWRFSGLRYGLMLMLITLIILVVQ